MSETKHTPGEWTTECSGWLFKGEPTYIIPEIMTGREHAILNKADADLAAAAPDLREMAEAHEKQHEHRKVCPECNGPNRPCDEGKALITRVYSLRILALAKVRGEEPEI